jgi:tetratricopeptide (TPR) repeat protein
VTYRKLLLPAILLLSLSASPQFKNGVGNLKVRVTDDDGRSAGARLRVQLMNSASNNAMGEEFTNDQGEAEFYSIDAGDYHVLVTGDGIQDADSGIIEVDDRKGSQSVSITVVRTGEGAHARTPSISVNQLKIPSEAKAKYAEASQLMAKSDYAGAIQRLNQAIAIDPAYVEAYNNLAAANTRLGNWSQAREALLKATRVDDHFAPGFVNLGHLDERELNFQAAETQYAKAAELDPANVATLTYLCRAQLLDKHYDAAIATAQRVHGLPHPQLALVHYIAARAYQHENRTANAIAEFKIMLREEPSGARADAVRKEVATMESKAH